MGSGTSMFFYHSLRACVLFYLWLNNICFCFVFELCVGGMWTVVIYVPVVIYVEGYLIMCFGIIILSLMHKVSCSSLNIVVIISCCPYCWILYPSIMCLHFKRQIQSMHISRGSNIHFSQQTWSFWILLQILVLSSNTKKGEIERAFLRSLVFCVLVNNTSAFLIRC